MTKKPTHATHERPIHEIDATGQAVGRLASEIAKLLRGKDSARFDPHLDAGGSVVVLHASKVIFTGRKLAQKDYYHHTMFPGGIKRIPMKRVFEKNPADVIKHAVNGMLPKNSFRKEMMKRLTFRD